MKYPVAMCGLLGLGTIALACSQQQDTEDINQRTAAVVEEHCASLQSPLLQAACSAERLVGAAVGYQPLTGDPAYADAVANEFDYVTPENAMKWGPLQPTDSASWSFGEADTIVDTAVESGQSIKGHTLVWHRQLPSFVTGSLEANELDKLLRKHIKETVKRYREHVQSWDVVNEALLDDGTLRPSVFLNAMGPDYIAEAFRAANEYLDEDGYPGELVYNDYGIATVNPKSDAAYALLADLLAQGVPVDSIGFQMHLDARYAPTTEELLVNFGRFADLGLGINISELDVRIAGVSGTELERLALQQQVFHRVASACVQTPACNAISVWGVTDAYSWLSPDQPLLLDESYGRKPAYRGLVDGLMGLTPDESPAPNLASSGSFETDAAGFYPFGDIELERTTALANTGRQSLSAGGRTAAWQGPALDLTPLVQPGFEYTAAALVAIAGAASETVGMWLKTQCAGENADYTPLDSATASDASFTPTSGAFSIPSCELADAALYFQEAAAGVTILIDDLVLHQLAEPLGPELVQGGDFEGGVGSSWYGFGGPTLAPTADANTGSGALLATGRAANWQGPATTLTSLVIPGATYKVSAFAKIAGAESANVKLTVKTVCDGATTYPDVDSVTANSLGYTWLSGSYKVPLCDDLGDVTLYLQGPDAGVDILVDDVSMAQRLSIPVEEPGEGFDLVTNGGGESGTAGWVSFGSTISQSGAYANSGDFSISGSARGGSWAGPAYELAAGEADYDVAVYGLHDFTSDQTLSLSAKLVCGGDTYLTLGSAVAAPGTWVPLQGTLSVPAGCTQVQLYLNGPDGAATVYADDLSAIPTSVVNLAGNGGGELGLTGWANFGSSVAQSDAYANSGTYSVVGTERAGTWAGPSYIMPSAAGQYEISTHALHATSAPLDLVLNVKTTCGGTDQYHWLATQSAGAQSWVELSGTVTVGSDCTAAQAYVNGPATSVDIYLDDLIILPIFQ